MLSFLPVLLFFFGGIVAWFPWLFYWVGTITIVLATLAVFKKMTPEFLFFLCGSEVVYRMAPDIYPWETARYAFIAVLLFEMGKSFNQFNLKYLGYFILLMVSLIFNELAPINEVKSGLIGPLCLCLFLTYPWRFQHWDIKKLALSFMLPISFLLGISLWGLFFYIFNLPSENPEEVFRWVYRWRATTLSFSPNQVGWVFSFSFIFFSTIHQYKKDQLYKWFSLACLGGCLLCFSRGPMIVGFITFLMFSHVRKALSWKVLVPVFLILLLLPGIALFRFTSLDDSGRVKNALAEIYLFKENPWIGVGPGNGKTFRDEFSGADSSHVEWLRLMSEHGIFGIFFIFLICKSTFQRKVNWKIWAPIGFWSMCYFSHSGFRNLTPIFMILWGQFLSYLHAVESQGNSLQDCPD